MKNLLNFFFSFDKLFKEKLVVPFFWLSLIAFGLAFFAEGLENIALGPLAGVLTFFNYFVSGLLGLVIIRILAELMVAIFRINDNLSPDGGKSELADIDPVAEARKAAELAANRTREATKSVGDRASSATKNLRENVEDATESVTEKAKATTASVKSKTETLTQSSKERAEKAMGKSAPAAAPKKRGRPKGSTNKPTTSAAPKKRGRPAGSKNKPKSSAAAKPATTTETPKRRGRPPGSKNKKPSTTKPKTTAAPKKRGPKKGAKIPRDADGNLLKKDGTPRAKPGRKPKS